MKVLLCIAMCAMCLGFGLWLGGVLVPGAVEAWRDAGERGARVTLDAAPALPGPAGEVGQGSSPQLGESEYHGPRYSAAYIEHGRRAQLISIWLGGALLLMGPLLMCGGCFAWLINEPFGGSRDR